MKLIAAFCLLTGFWSTANAQDSGSVAIVNHPAVKGIMQLAGGACVPPQPADVGLRCRGLRLPVTKPEIQSSGCSFLLVVKCMNKNVLIKGEVQHYSLETPEPNQVLPTKDEVVITTVEGGV